MEHICFYSQAEKFQKITERAVEGLYSAALDAADALESIDTQARDAAENARLRSEKMSQFQEETLDRQRGLSQAVAETLATTVLAPF